MFIDIDEIEEGLGEYHDFSEFTERDWNEIDELVEHQCKKLGVSQYDYEPYITLCDAVISGYLAR